MTQSGYGNCNQGNMVAAHRGHMMEGMYQQQQQQQFFNNQNTGPFPMGQYNQQNSSYGPMMGYSNQNRVQGHPPSGAPHIHARHQNPQEVANNILQMAASYQPSQTVQVPLNAKPRSAPYHVPVSSHYSVPNHPNKAEQQTSRQFNYPNSSPHHNPHGSRTSPVSPGSMFMHSPASHHSSQSLPNSSPRSIHSPPACGNIRSPVPTPSPAGSMRSPCHMQSPVNTPINQQLHISTGQQMVQSPPQQQLGYSPKNNPISPPVGQPLQCKQQQNMVQHPGKQQYMNEVVAGNNSNNPLQSLQKLCMLPDRQVVDPKSIVNDSSPSPNQNQKNVNSDVDSYSEARITISEPASTNTSTDGTNCDKSSTSDNLPVSTISPETPGKKTTIESYADDAVKCSTDKSVKVEIDTEKQKLMYLGQPCSVNSESSKNSPSECVQKHDELTAKPNQISEPQPDGIVCDKNNIENDKTSSEKSENETKNELKNNSCGMEVEVRTVTHKNLHVLNANEKQETVEFSESVDSINSSNDMNQCKGDNPESLADICDKSLVDGCETTHCDDQAKTDIDCRKDEVKSMVNGGDDSDEVCSDLDSNKNDMNKKAKAEYKKDPAIIKKTVNNQEKNESKRLREVPARIASSSPYYIDASDSEDESMLMVRKDVKYTYSRCNKINRESIVSVSDNDIIVTDDESLDRNSLDSDMSKGFDCDLTTPKPKSSTNGSSSNQGHKKKNVTAKPLKKREPKPFMDSSCSGSKDQSEKQRSCRSKRTRTATSKYADEMYLGDDFVLDSEEENEIEKKSKRIRKVSGEPRVTTKAKFEDKEIIIDSDDEVLLDSKVCKKLNNPHNHQKSTFAVTVKSEEISVDSDSELIQNKNLKKKRKVSGDTTSSVSVKSEEISVNSKSGVIHNKNLKKTRKVNSEVAITMPLKSENEDSTNPSDSHDVCIDIIDSSDNLGDGSDIISFKYGKNMVDNCQPTPSTSKSLCSNKTSMKRGTSKSKTKSKVTHLGKSKSRGKLLDDSMKNMKLKKTMNLMKQKGKKKTDIPVKEVGPFLKIKDSGTPKEKCSVVNQQIEETGDKNTKNKKSAVRVSTVHVSRLPSEKSVHLPSNMVGETTQWVCALCNKHSSYKFLGDLFGPYYVEGNLPSDESSNVSDKKGKQKRQSLVASVQAKVSKSQRKSKDNLKPHEVWVHEDCATWSDGVLLIGAKMYGLAEATDIASSTVSVKIFFYEYNDFLCCNTHNI